MVKESEKLMEAMSSAISRLRNIYVTEEGRISIKTKERGQENTMGSVSKERDSL